MYILLCHRPLLLFQLTLHVYVIKFLSTCPAVWYWWSYIKKIPSKYLSATSYIVLLPVYGRVYLFHLLYLRNWNSSKIFVEYGVCWNTWVKFMLLEASWNVMVHAQKPCFVFRRNGRVYWNRWLGRQFSRLLAAEVCASAVVMLDTPCSEVVWRVLATHSIRQFPLQFPSRASHFN